MLFQIILVASSLVGSLAIPTPHDSHDDHSHNTRKALPDTWYQPRDHPVHALFKRAPGDGTNYPAVGSPEWSAGYPMGPPNPNSLPADWVTALNAAVAAGKIPNIPQSSNAPNQNPVYPTGANPNGPAICSATYKCRIPGDIWDSPDGVFASSFDDGPSPLTPQLVDFLAGHNDTTTHFMIGINILYYPTQFLSAFNAGHDIAVHTWTHPYMTTLSNLQILGELGYTMKLIHDSTGGRLPRYWRPPYGDSDMRVRSIALEIFGLQTVVWNQDSEDWAGTPASIESALTNFLALPKTPGLIILEHEIASVTVNAFITAYPQIEAAGWKFMSLAKAVNNGASYQNAQSSTSDDVVKADIIVGLSSTSSTSTTSTTSTTTTSETSATSTTSTSTSTEMDTTSTTNTNIQNLTPTNTPTSSANTLQSTRIFTLCGVLSTFFILLS